jgi:hypothetical protein
MANTTSKQDMDLVSGLSIFRIADPDGTGDATQDDLNSGAATVYLVQITNTANLATKVYFKLYNAANPTIGTTAPDMVIPCPGGSTVKMAIIEGCALSTALSVACVTNGGGTGGTTAPTSDVPCIIVAS